MTCGCGQEKNWCVKAGATFYPTIRWAQKTLTAAVITAITQATPAVVTAPAHGMPNGWPAAVVGVNGMSFINASRYPPDESDLHQGTVTDANDVAFNDISSTLWPAYIPGAGALGGSLVWYTPQPLAGVTFTMSFYSDAAMETTPLVTLTNGNGITVDTVGMTIVPLLQTAPLVAPTTGVWPSNGIGYYRLMATDSSGIDTEIMFGTLTIQ